MYSDRTKRSLKPLLWLLFALLLLSLLCFFLLKDAGRDLSEEGAQAIRAAIERSAGQCYAVEGVYPPNLAYLEQNYGLSVNREDYYISYEAFASNLPPTVRVIKK